MKLSDLRKWVCKYCGTRVKTMNRPAPGMCVRREKTKDGKRLPHAWIKDN